MNGQIIRIVTDKGFGFIRGEDGQEYFAHRSAFLGNVVFETVREGQRVTFDATVARSDRARRTCGWRKVERTQPRTVGGMMDSLANLLKHFVVRDLIYAIAGGILMVGVVFATGDLSQQLVALEDAPLIVSFLFAGIAWAVGYAVSDGLGGLLPTLLPSGVLRFWPFVPPFLLQTTIVGDGRTVVTATYQGKVGSVDLIFPEPI